jgi:nucleoid DNA-binding protein
MTFIELVEHVANSTGAPKKVVKAILYSATLKIHTKVKDFGGEVKIPGFGRFSPRKTRGGKAFGRDLTPRDTIKFTPYI